MKPKSLALVTLGAAIALSMPAGKPLQAAEQFFVFDVSLGGISYVEKRENTFKDQVFMFLMRTFNGCFYRGFHGG